MPKNIGIINENDDIVNKKYVDDNIGQTDWLENNTESPAFLKNKPKIKNAMLYSINILDDVEIETKWNEIFGGN